MEIKAKYTSPATGFEYVDGWDWVDSRGCGFTLRGALDEFMNVKEFYEEAREWLLDFSMNFLAESIGQPDFVLALHLVQAGILEPDLARAVANIEE